MRRTSEKGFTLIELLLVTAIIGILAVLAIPQYRMYATKACNSAAMSDLKGLQISMEAAKVDTGRYPNY